MGSEATEEAIEIPVEEGLRVLDREAQKFLGISGDEFIRRWKAGDYDEEREDACPGLVRLLMLLPFAGEEPFRSRA